MFSAAQTQQVDRMLSLQWTLAWQSRWPVVMPDQQKRKLLRTLHVLSTTSMCLFKVIQTWVMRQILGAVSSVGHYVPLPRWMMMTSATLEGGLVPETLVLHASREG